MNSTPSPNSSHNTPIWTLFVGGLVLGCVFGVGGALSVLGKGTPLEPGAANSSASGEASGTPPSGHPAASTPASQECSLGSAPSKDLFVVDGHTITRDMLSTDAQDALYQIESRNFEEMSAFSKELGLRMALSKTYTFSKPVPPLKDVLPGTQVTEADMKSFFESNKGSLPPGTTYDQVKGQLHQYLVAQKGGDIARKRIEDLESSGRLRLALVGPIPPLVSLKLDGYPTMGSPNAKATLVEVSDYLCPHCRHAHPDVQAVVKQYGSQLKFVQINFPLSPQGLSAALARGGICAQQQGGSETFWKYHEKAFAVPFEAMHAVSPNAEKEFNGHAEHIAQELGLNVPTFSKCLVDKKTEKALEETTEEMTKVGVGGTPTFFLNNRKVTLTAMKEAVAQAVR